MITKRPLDPIALSLRDGAACGFNHLASGEIWLLLIHVKSARENIPAHVLKAIREKIEDADD